MGHINGRRVCAVCGLGSEQRDGKEKRTDAAVDGDLSAAGGIWLGRGDGQRRFKRQCAQFQSGIVL